LMQETIHFNKPKSTNGFEKSWDVRIDSINETELHTSTFGNTQKAEKCTFVRVKS